MSLKIVFISANSADLDEMPPYAAFHLDSLFVNVPVCPYPEWKGLTEV